MTRFDQVMALARRSPLIHYTTVAEKLDIHLSDASALLKEARARIEADRAAPEPWRHPTPHADRAREAAIDKARRLVAAGDDPSAAVNQVRQLYPDAAIGVEGVR